MFQPSVELCFLTVIWRYRSCSTSLPSGLVMHPPTSSPSSVFLLRLVSTARRRQRDRAVVGRGHRRRWRQSLSPKIDSRIIASVPWLWMAGRQLYDCLNWDDAMVGLRWLWLFGTGDQSILKFRAMLGVTFGAFTLMKYSLVGMLIAHWNA